MSDNNDFTNNISEWHSFAGQDDGSITVDDIIETYHDFYDSNNQTDSPEE